MFVRRPPPRPPPAAGAVTTPLLVRAAAATGPPLLRPPQTVQPPVPQLPADRSIKRGSAVASGSNNNNSSGPAVNLEELWDTVVLLIASARAPATLALRETAVRRFDGYLTAAGITISPAGISDRDLVLYVAYLYQEKSIASFGTISNYISQGVRIWHFERGMPWIPIAERSPFVGYSMDGAQRRMAANTNANRKLPLTIAILEVMFTTAIDLTNPLHVCWWCAAVISFFLLLRKQHIAPDPRRLAAAVAAVASARTNAKTPTAVIRRGDVTFDPAAGRVWIQLNATKTRQPGFARFELNLPLPAIVGSNICPTSALLLHLRLLGQRPAHEPLFIYRGADGGLHQLTHQVFVSLLKQFLRTAGINPDQYAGHSFRRGGATFAFSQAGLPQLYIRAMGDWLSNAFLLYCEAQESLRVAGADAMAAAVRDAAAAFLASNPQMAHAAAASAAAAVL